MERYNPNGQGDKLLTELKEKRLNLIQFQAQVAKWLLDPEVWNTFHPKKFPAKTRELLEHEMMNSQDRKNLGVKYYEDNPEILKFYSKQQVILAYNEQRVHDLTEFMDVMDSAETYEKLKERRAEFQQEVGRQGSELGVTRYIHPEAERVAEVFGGKIE